MPIFIITVFCNLKPKLFSVVNRATNVVAPQHFSITCLQQHVYSQSKTSTKPAWNLSVGQSRSFQTFLKTFSSNSWEMMILYIAQWCYVSLWRLRLSARLTLADYSLRHNVYLVLFSALKHFCGLRSLSVMNMHSVMGCNAYCAERVFGFSQQKNMFEMLQWLVGFDH